MRHTSRRQLMGLSLSFAMLLTVAGGTTASATAPAGARPVRQGFVATKVSGLRPGDRVSLDGISLLVPTAGMGSWGSALPVAGPERTLGVKTGADGSVTVLRKAVLGGSAPAQTNAPATPLAPGACQDPAYLLEGSSWSTTYGWYFNMSSTPSGITQDNARSNLRNAVSHITHADNGNCGLPDRISATSAYQGSTSRSANIGTNGSCLGSDGTSVVDFGDLPSSELGYVCWWTQGTKTVEADMRLNKFDYSWVTNIDGCNNKYDVEDVATHEFGHVFGLADLNPNLHPALTMASSMNPCTLAQTTLGLGDVLGLQVLY